MLPRSLLALAPLLLGACGAGHASDAVSVAPASRVQARPDGVPPRPLQVGVASWYGPRHQGAATASGARYDMRALTAAHPTLSLGTRIRVTRLETGQSVVVTVNDRGPHVGRRIVDLSWRAAQELDMLRSGLATVSIGTEDPLSVAPPARRAVRRAGPAGAEPLAVAAAPEPDAREARP